MASTLKVYRICKNKYANDLKGTGAYISGGRWNTVGNFVLYTSSTVSLSMLEVLVHVSSYTWPNDMSLVTIQIPDGSIKNIEINDLPKDWNTLPSSDSAQKIGDQWLSENKFLVLSVPSVVNPYEVNYLINPDHPLFRDIQIEKIEPWSFDQRFKNASLTI